MERVDQICRHPLWRACMDEIRELERERRFCRHDTAHCLDVARLAWIENLERSLGLDRELIYAAALLHDAGRGLQYLEGTPHEQAGAAVAETVLADCGFSEGERAAVLSAILQHRALGTEAKEDLAGLICRADKRSRACLFCAAMEDCNWSPERKNLVLQG